MAYSIDRYSKHSTTLDSPSVDAFEVVDSNTFPASRAVYIGSTGNLKVEMLTYDGSNTEVTFTNVQQGTILPIRIVRVDMANTTSNNVLVLY